MTRKAIILPLVLVLAVIVALLVLLTPRGANGAVTMPACPATTLTRTGNQTSQLLANNSQGTWALNGATWNKINSDYPVRSDAWTKACAIGGTVFGRVPRTYTRDMYYNGVGATEIKGEAWRQDLTSTTGNWAINRDQYLTDFEDAWDPNAPKDSGYDYYIDHGHAEWIRDDCIENEGSGTAEGPMSIHVNNSLWDGCFTVFAARPTYAGGAVKNGSGNATLEVQDSLIYSNPQPLGPMYCASSDEASHRCKANGSNQWLGSHGIWKWSSAAPKTVVMSNVTFRLDQPSYSSCSPQVWPDGTYTNVRLLWTANYPYASAGGCTNTVPAGVTIVNASGSNPQVAIDEWNTKKAAWLAGNQPPPPPPTNTAPSVNAGTDGSVVRPNTKALDGTVTDDGLPSGSTVTTTWSKVSGPGTVTFGSASSVDTTAAFSAAGTYTLRLTASDGALTNSDDVVVTVTDAAPPPDNDPVVASPATPTGQTGNWDTTFVDEFAGTTLDSTKWNNTWFGEGTVQNNAPTYSENVSVQDGYLKLKLSTHSDGQVGGATVHTAPDQNAAGSRYAFPIGSLIEARVRFSGASPGGSGQDNIYNFPAWWTSGPNWPSNGEFDIAEGLGGDLAINYHYGQPGQDLEKRPPDPAGLWQNDYHTYSVYRKATTAEVYWDGVLKATIATEDAGAAHDVIMNMGKPSSTSTRLPVLGDAGALRIDYVRAYKPATAPPPVIRNPSATDTNTTCGNIDIDYATDDEDTASSDFDILVDGTVAFSDNLAPGQSGLYSRGFLEDESGGSVDIVVKANGTTIFTETKSTDCVQAPPPSGVSFVGSSEAESNAASVTLPMPTGTVAGDTVLFHVVHNKGDRSTFTTPGGLTAVGTRANDGGSLATQVYKCVVGSGCPSSAVVFSTAGETVYQMSATAEAYHGVSAVNLVATAIEGSTDTAHPVTGTTASEGWNVVLGADRKTGAAGTVPSNWTFGATLETRREGGQCVTDQTAGCISQGVADTAALKPAASHTYTAGTSNSVQYAITRLVEIH